MFKATETTWESFVTRRSISPDVFVKNLSIESYDQLVRHLAALGVRPPLEGDVSHLFKRAKETPDSASPASFDPGPASVEVVSTPSPKRPTRTTTKEKSEDNE